MIRGGTVALLVFVAAGCGSTSATSAQTPPSTTSDSQQYVPPPLPRRKAAGYRIEAGPTVLYADSKTGPLYVVYVRLNKALPRRREFLQVDRNGGDDLDVSSLASHCYTMRFSPASPRTSLLDRTRDGLPVTVDVMATNQPGSRIESYFLSVRARARRVATTSQIGNGDRYVKPRLRRLGCKNPSD